MADESAEEVGRRTTPLSLATGASQRPSAGPATVRIHRRIVEALMEGVRSHPEAQAAVSQGLAAAAEGADPTTLALADFHRLVGTVAALLDPEDPRVAGARLAGRAFFEGWSRHPSGRVFVDSLRTLPLTRAVVRLSDGLRFGSEGLALEGVLLGATRMRLILRGSRRSNAPFFCGCMETMLGLLGATGVQAIPEPSPEGTQRLLISWEPPT